MDSGSAGLVVLAIVCWTDELLCGRGDPAHRSSLVWGSFWGGAPLLQSPDWLVLQAVTMETTAADLCVCVPVTICVCVCVKP